MITQTEDTPYCCLECYNKFTLGALVPSEHGFFGLGCPFCRGGVVHPYNLPDIIVSQYRGPIGTRQ